MELLYYPDHSVYNIIYATRVWSDCSYIHTTRIVYMLIYDCRLLLYYIKALNKIHVLYYDVPELARERRDTRIMLCTTHRAEAITPIHELLEYNIYTDAVLFFIVLTGKITRKSKSILYNIIVSDWKHCIFNFNYWNDLFFF